MTGSKKTTWVVGLLHCPNNSTFLVPPVMDLKQMVVRALKNIIHKQARMSLNSRFLFMRILKNVATLDTLSSLEVLKTQRFVKEKSYQKILQEVQRLARNEEFEDLGFDCPVFGGEGVSQGSSYYSDSSIIVCSQTQFQEISSNGSDCLIITDRVALTAPEARNDEEELFNSLSDLRLGDGKLDHPVNSQRKSANMCESAVISANAESSKPVIETVSSLESTASDDGAGADVQRDTADCSVDSGKHTIRKRRYIPGYRTAPYAVLKALYGHDGSHKHLIILKATQYTDTAFDSRQAFSAFKVLVKRGLVSAERNHKYHLTETGRELCCILFSDSPGSPPEDQEVKLIIDSREKKSGRDRVFFQSHFLSKSIPNETRFLCVGDFLWIKNENILGHIVERKQRSDFASSISDGRYREQKHRLKSLGMCVYYLIESLRVEESRENYVQRCLLETRMDGLVVLETENIAESAWVLEMIDRRVRGLLKDPGAGRLVTGSENVLVPTKDTSHHCCMSYGSFLNEASKDNLKVGDMLLIALLGIKGLSRDFAVALSEKHLTLSNFRRGIASEAFKNEIRSLRVGERQLGERMVRKIVNLLK